MDFACGSKVAFICPWEPCALGSPCVIVTTVLLRMLVLDRAGGFSCYLVMSLASLLNFEIKLKFVYVWG